VIISQNCVSHPFSRIKRIDQWIVVPDPVSTLSTSAKIGKPAIFQWIGQRAKWKGRCVAGCRRPLVHDVQVGDSPARAAARAAAAAGVPPAAAVEGARGPRAARADGAQGRRRRGRGRSTPPPPPRRATDAARRRGRQTRQRWGGLAGASPPWPPPSMTAP